MRLYVTRHGRTFRKKLTVCLVVSGVSEVVAPSSCATTSSVTQTKGVRDASLRDSINVAPIPTNTTPYYSAPGNAEQEADLPRLRAIRTDHAVAKETMEDRRVNAVLAPSPSYPTTRLRNQRCPRSACRQTISLFL
eukprot:3205042-Pleurochrysis_carterae.AAC.1